MIKELKYRDYDFEVRVNYDVSRGNDLPDDSVLITIDSVDKNRFDYTVSTWINMNGVIDYLKEAEDALRRWVDKFIKINSDEALLLTMGFETEMDYYNRKNANAPVQQG